MNLDSLEKKCDEVAGILKLIAHPTKLVILCHLAERECTVTELVKAAGISQSQTSQFLGRMKEESLLDSKRNGNQMLYHIKDERVLKMLKSFKNIFC